MLQLELPHINVLTKIDNLPSYGELPMRLKFYTEARSLEYLDKHLEDEQRGSLRSALSNVPLEGEEYAEDENVDEEQPPKSKFYALNKAIIELVEDFGLVGFETLCVEDRQSMWQLSRAIDRAGGFAFGGPEGLNQANAWELAVREGGGGQMMDVNDIEERWVSRREELDEAEREQWKREGKEQKQQTDTDGLSAGIGSDFSNESGIKVVRKL